VCKNLQKKINLQYTHREKITDCSCMLLNDVVDIDERIQSRFQRCVYFSCEVTVTSIRSLAIYGVAQRPVHCTILWAKAYK